VLEEGAPQGSSGLHRRAAGREDRSLRASPHSFIDLNNPRSSRVSPESAAQNPGSIPRPGNDFEFDAQRATSDYAECCPGLFEEKAGSSTSRSRVRGRSTLKVMQNGKPDPAVFIGVLLPPTLASRPRKKCATGLLEACDYIRSSTWAHRRLRVLPFSDDTSRAVTLLSPRSGRVSWARRLRRDASEAAREREGDEDELLRSVALPECEQHSRRASACRAAKRGVPAKLKGSVALESFGWTVSTGRDQLVRRNHRIFQYDRATIRPWISFYNGFTRKTSPS